jgi:glycerol-3-phosphate acyltransferase PlsY
VTISLISLPVVAVVALGYLLGSIPFGLLLTRAAGLGDVRKIGSGNIGATNVLRTGNKGLAAATLLLDALKATAAVLIAHMILKSVWGFRVDYVPGFTTGGAGPAATAFLGASLAGVAAFIGHIYPVWLGFKGGKGVATYIGALLGIFWPSALVFCGVWLIVALTLRISSLAALVASLLAPLYPLYLGERGLALVLAAMTILVYYTHRANIARLRAGTEPKIGAKS